MQHQEEQDAPPPIDLITHAALRELRAFTRSTGQPTSLDQLDLEPMRAVKRIEITDEHITITYNERVTRSYNVNAYAFKEWEYKYNDDPEFVRAIAAVIDLARKHLRDMPDNVACPPGCAECCSAYEPFVTREDVQRIADHLELSYEETLRDYVVPRVSADGNDVGYLRKTGDELTDPCVFLKGSRSGRHYCGIYPARPDSCRDFSPIGCADVDTSLPRRGAYPVGPPFRPPRRRRRSTNGSARR